MLRHVVMDPGETRQRLRLGNRYTSICGIHSSDPIPGHGELANCLACFVELSSPPYSSWGFALVFDWDAPRLTEETP